MINLKLIQLFECFCSDCTNCTCYFFLDKAICYHIVACCLLDDINYLGLKDKQFTEKNNLKNRTFAMLIQHWIHFQNLRLVKSIKVYYFKDCLNFAFFNFTKFYQKLRNFTEANFTDNFDRHITHKIYREIEDY
ncbi:hypothetical protein BpHYR1_013556 [Brachionus plicatilis]|uniref:SWIM-type domain-containing protein n=1 Tax=Brachionus plicatilis TaxID=10195 RepID=A0A3M7QDE5_BRAPC|nr:hypothetical protein BpHYR1_013556 [Brachionus plicatilis]